MALAAALHALPALAQPPPPLAAWVVLSPTGPVVRAITDAPSDVL